MIEIVFVDHQTAFRNKICRALSLQQDFELAGLGGDGYEAIRLVQKLKPDVVFLEMDLPLLNGFQAAPLLKYYAPSAEIIILAGTDTALQGIDLDHFKHISGYLTRTTSVDLIYQAVRTVHYGGRLIAPEIVKQLENLNVSHAPQEKAGHLAQEERSFPGKISRTELEIMTCIRHGLTTREISQQLCLTEGTVRNYISSVLQKMDLHDRTQMAIYAIKAGL